MKFSRKEVYAILEGRKRVIRHKIPGKLNQRYCLQERGPVGERPGPTRAHLRFTHFEPKKARDLTDTDVRAAGYTDVAHYAECMARAGTPLHPADDLWLCDLTVTHRVLQTV